MLEASPIAALETVGDLLRAVETALAGAGVPEPRAEARRVLQAAGIAATEIVARPDRALGEIERRRIAAIARRRAAREPLSRIMGEREFFGRAFEISPATLDPRADSETLIEAALEIAREEKWSDAPIRLIDVGTGSGCLLVTLLAEFPNAVGLGTDVSRDALAVARRNAERHGVSARSRFEVRRSLSGVGGTIDLLVSNPPYVPTAAIADLDPEVREFDPLAALDGGSDGLDIYREIAGQLARAVPRGWALFEAGAGQADAIAGCLQGKEADSRTPETRSWQDLGRHVRCIGIKLRS